jgi:hypothetical protein
MFASWQVHRQTSMALILQLVFNAQNDFAAKSGISDFDPTHRLVISGTWNMPERSVRHVSAYGARKLSK